ncbi:UNVERIFIED_CONTAM: molybdopterin-dependent oxidoreductase, partial [Bacillus amyloliquefaciens DSM 7 = ATCC 23350]
ITWCANVPVTTTPDAHFLAEARYKGAKVISVRPDFAASSKFTDDWLSIRQGTDGEIAMATGHVILQEFYVNQETEHFIKYAKQYTDFPFLVTLSK